MATRSSIALEFPNGAIKQVYCHWDGYIEHNGKILFENYSDPEKLKTLLDLGDLSSLGIDIGTKHDFDERTKYCTFYGRDNNQLDTKAEIFSDFQTYLKIASFQEYNYILRNDGKWYVSYDIDNKFVLLYNEFVKIETESLK